MTEQDAAKLCQLVCDQYGKDAGRLVVLGRGDEYAVYICRPGYFLWDWPDFTAYRKQEKQAQKRKRGRPRREESYQTAISYTQEHTLLLAM
jgi:hypothetical protein